MAVTTVPDFIDYDPTTPLSGARLTQLVEAVRIALEVPDSALAARLNDPESLAGKALAGKVSNTPKGERWANVRDYFDVGRVEGTTDDRPAMESARLTGRPVYIPSGHYYISESPDWGTNTVVMGDGIDRTVIHLMDSSPASADLWSNGGLFGEAQIYYSDFTLDGNCQRQGGNLPASGGSRSSGLTFRNVQYAWVDRVKVMNPVQHCFDVTRGSLDYAYVGDGLAATLRSSHIWFDQVQGSNWGDDGFTCHSSDFIHVTRSVFYNPRLRGNCNGIEIDGDSRYCTARGNQTFNCYAGIEVKGHGTESAAREIQISDHIDTGSVRSYNFRHIGYQTGADPTTQSARNIICTNLTSINPNNDAGFQDDSAPRALSISAYRGIQITGFTAVGRGGYDVSAIAIQIQYRASEVTLSGVTVTGWTGAEYDLSITTNGKVNVFGFSSWESANSGFYVGATIAAANLSNFVLTGPAAGGVCGADIYNSTNVNTSNMHVTGYATPWRADLTNYSSYRLFTRQTANVPAGTTRLVDLDPTRPAFYASTSVMSGMTDGPGLGGAGLIRHTEIAGDVYVQTVTRNTTGATIQGRAWRICYTNQTAGPWNRESINDLVPISGILPNGGTPPVGAAAGSVWLVRSA